jgi:hypothetical protein
LVVASRMKQVMSAFHPLQTLTDAALGLRWQEG